MSIRILLASFAAALLSACASVPMGDSKQDATNKTFTTKTNAAGVYIYRNESIGAAIRMDVEVDGKPVGQTAAKTYFYVEVPSGTHTITSKSENDDSLTMEMVAGKLYFVWQEVKMGLLYARTKLNLMPEDEGKRGVLECQLALASSTSIASTPQMAKQSKEEQLTELKRLFDQGLITQAVYLEKQKSILEAN
jgi:hypothetical protein